MLTPKVVLTNLLALLFSTTVFAEYKHHVAHKNQYRHAYHHGKSLHQEKSKQWAAHKIERHYRSHRGFVENNQKHQLSYHRHSGRMVYRAVKSHSTYEDRRHDAYRLIAGTIVLNEVYITSITSALVSCGYGPCGTQV